MKSEDMIRALNNIDPDMIEDAEQNRVKRPMAFYLRRGLVAACVCLLVGGVALAFGLRERVPPSLPIPGETDSTDSGQDTESGDDTQGPEGTEKPPETDTVIEDPISPLPPPPVYGGAKYSMSQLAELLDRQLEGVPTNAYTEVEYLAGKTPGGQIPTAQYLSIYEYVNSNQPIDQERFKEFVEGILPNLAEALGEATPTYEIEQDESYDGQVSLRVWPPVDFSNIHTGFFQNNTWERAYFSNHTGDSAVVINGREISIDRRQSNEEILTSLEGVKEELFELFGVTFTDVKVRQYSDGVCIYFYNKRDIVFPVVMDITDVDHIEIRFYNNSHSSSQAASDAILNHVHVNHTRYRNSAKDRYREMERLSMISLEEAEALLCNGYVYGGHICRLCMADQEKIAFEDYDYVGFEYLSGIDYKTGTPTSYFPFYTFYKKLYTAENGNDVYAKTYVCAIQLSGYEEYFESQVADHMYFN